MNGCIAEVVIWSRNDVGFHLSPIVLDSELELGCVKDNLEMKMLAKINVNQLLLWNSLNECRNKFELRLGCVENVACQIEKGKMAGSILARTRLAPQQSPQYGKIKKPSVGALQHSYRIPVARYGCCLIDHIDGHPVAYSAQVVCDLDSWQVVWVRHIAHISIYKESSGGSKMWVHGNGLW